MFVLWLVSVRTPLYMPDVHHPCARRISAAPSDFPFNRPVLFALKDALGRRPMWRVGVSTLKEAAEQSPSPPQGRVFRPGPARGGWRCNCRGFSRKSKKLKGLFAPKIMRLKTKCGINACAGSLAAARSCGFMPTVESAQFFDPGRIHGTGAKCWTITTKAGIAADQGWAATICCPLWHSDGTRASQSWEGPLGVGFVDWPSSMLISAGYFCKQRGYLTILPISTNAQALRLNRMWRGFRVKDGDHLHRSPISLTRSVVSDVDVKQARAILDDSAGGCLPDRCCYVRAVNTQSLGTAAIIGKIRYCATGPRKGLGGVLQNT